MVAALNDLRQRRSFRVTVLRWYDQNQRALPWRGTRDPYRIWVSEIMLQQTRVAAASGYYKRFLKAFPTMSALARACEQEVLCQWSGLGYYRRARMLHAAAKQLVSERRRIPATSAGLRELPGIGRYTAAAIASIAFGEATAVVDGNVERVLQRMSGTQNTSEDIWTCAQTLLDANRPGDFNQAMMELGATVCLPKTPLCAACPVKRWCETQGIGASVNRGSRLRAKVSYVLDVRGGKIALVQRAHNARLMPGMWELPQARLRSRSGVSVMQLRHSITKTDFVVDVRRGRAATSSGSVQLKLQQAAKLPLTGLTKKILQRMACPQSK